MDHTLVRLAVLVSGEGTNLQALIAARARGELAPAELAIVLSNRPDAGALDRAAAAGIEAVVVDHTRFEDRTAFERGMLDELQPRNVEAIVLAGFMRILTETFLAAFPQRVINTHPSLLPAFPGIRAPGQALEHGSKVTGCTIHFVEAGVDCGPIIAQCAVEVRDDDDAASLHARIQQQEYRLLPIVAAQLASNRLVCEGRRVRLR